MSESGRIRTDAKLRKWRCRNQAFRTVVNGSVYSYIRPKYAGAIKMGTNNNEWDRNLHFGTIITINILKKE